MNNPVKEKSGTEQNQVPTDYFFSGLAGLKDLSLSQNRLGEVISRVWNFPSLSSSVSPVINKSDFPFQLRKRA